MRWYDREIVDKGKIENIIESCECLRVGFNDNGEIYIVPLNFGYTCEDGKSVFYFHGACNGRKIDLIRRSPDVGFELDTDVHIRLSDKACGCTTAYKSIIGTGKASFVENIGEKKKALSLIMKHYTKSEGFAFEKTELDKVCVFKLEVKSLSCKENM